MQYVWIWKEKNFGPSDAGELTAGPCDPRVGLAPPTCRNVACTGLLHNLLSGTPTRGGSSLMAKLEHPSSGSVEALRPPHPLSLTGPPAKMLAGPLTLNFSLMAFLLLINVLLLTFIARVLWLSLSVCQLTTGLVVLFMLRMHPLYILSSTQLVQFI